MCSSYYLYHMCHEDDIGDYSKGYIGATKNPKSRLSDHTSSRCHSKKIIKKIRECKGRLSFKVLVKGSKEYILNLERKLRPSENIGWNQVVGGGKPPNLKGHKHDKAFSRKLSERQMGELNHAYGKPAHNKGKHIKDIGEFSIKPHRRDSFISYCKRFDLDINDFSETFAKWMVKPSGIRYRTYFYTRKQKCTQ